jgi:hypothetical protein
MRAMGGSMPDSNSAPVSDWKSTRFWLALLVTLVSIASVSILAYVIIREDKEKAQGVLNSVLPLLGTWVGTILAYYFSKENFEAATKSVTAIASQLTSDQKLQSIPVKSKMIYKAEMIVQKAPATGIKLTDVLNVLDQKKKGNRVPILGDKDEPVYIVHRSLIDSYLSSLARAGKPSADIAAQTLQTMLDADPDTKRMAETFATVKAEATLAEAKTAMDNLPDCQDVFVTQTGNKAEPVLGWITNVIIQDNAKV